MDEIFNPKISIIIPVYNGTNFLSEAIDSALNQTYDNIEIIVVNDGSTDDGATEKIALGYGNKIRYFKKENGGSSSALNLGIQQMTGDYFSWLSHDDLYEADKIKFQVDALSKQTNKNNVVLCRSRLIDAKGNQLPLQLKKAKQESKIIAAKDMFENFTHNHTINGCAVLMSKSLLNDVGYFDEKLVYLNDMDYWYRIAISGYDFLQIPEVLVCNRIHNQQVSIKKVHLLEIEKSILAEKIKNILIEKEKEIKYFISLLRFCAIENINTVATDICAFLKERVNKDYQVKAFAYRLLGNIIGTLKKIRRKIWYSK